VLHSILLLGDPEDDSVSLEVLEQISNYGYDCFRPKADHRHAVAQLVMCTQVTSLLLLA
jgi:hypothetical protein